MFYLKNYHHGPGRTRTTSHKQHLELGCAGATRSDGVILDKELVSWLKKSDKRRIYEGLKQFLVLEWECYPCAYLKFETMTPCCNILQWYCNSANDCAQWWPWLSIPNYPNVMQTISLVDSWYVYIYTYIWLGLLRLEISTSHQVLEVLLSKATENLVHWDGATWGETRFLQWVKSSCIIGDDSNIKA